MNKLFVCMLLSVVLGALVSPLKHHPVISSEQEIKKSEGEDDVAETDDDLKTAVQVLTNQLNQLQKQWSEFTNCSHIAFSVVSHKDFYPESVDTNIEYEVVYTNSGDGWKGAYNHFVAPAAGTYFFATSHVTDNDDWGRTAIVHFTSTGSQKIVSTTSSSLGYMGDANQVVLELEQGDVVSVQIMKECSDPIKSEPDLIFSSFSGFLIFASE